MTRKVALLLSFKMTNPSWTIREQKLMRKLRSIYLVELAVYGILFFLPFKLTNNGNGETLINSFWELFYIIPFIMLTLSTLFFIGSFTNALDKKIQTSHMAMPTFICMLLLSNPKFERYLNKLHTERMQEWQTRELTNFTTYLATNHTLDETDEKAVIRFVTYFLSHYSHALYVTDKGLPYRNSKKNRVYATEKTLYDFYTSNMLNRFQFHDPAIYTFITNYHSDLDDLELYTQTYHLMPITERKNHTHHINLWCAFYGEFVRSLYTHLDDTTLISDEEPRITHAEIDKLKEIEEDISKRYKDYLN